MARREFVRNDGSFGVVEGSQAAVDAFMAKLGAEAAPTVNVLRPDAVLYGPVHPGLMSYEPAMPSYYGAAMPSFCDAGVPVDEEPLLMPVVNFGGPVETPMDDGPLLMPVMDFGPSPLDRQNGVSAPARASGHSYAHPLVNASGAHQGPSDGESPLLPPEWVF